MGWPFSFYVEKVTKMQRILEHGWLIHFVIGW